jgi:hypothetical protein
VTSPLGGVRSIQLSYRGSGGSLPAIWRRRYPVASSLPQSIEPQARRRLISAASPLSELACSSERERQLLSSPRKASFGSDHEFAMKRMLEVHKSGFSVLEIDPGTNVSDTCSRLNSEWRAVGLLCTASRSACSQLCPSFSDAHQFGEEAFGNRNAYATFMLATCGVL